MKPLEDVRIIAVEQYGAGPWGSVHLADLGAEVIKIEDPSRAAATSAATCRRTPRARTRCSSRPSTATSAACRSTSTPPEGRAVFEDLVRKVSDAVYSNLRGDVPAKIGITYDDLKHLNPAIVCCSLSGFGMTGPRVKEPGYDYILQGLAGWMDVTGEPGRPADQVRAVDGRLLRRLRRRDLAARRRSTRRAATASAWTATSRSTTSPSRC